MHVHGTFGRPRPPHSGQRFFFALFASFRFLISLPLLDRPLVAGFFWGLCTGEYALSLGVSLFFELLWLDRFPAGTAIPPNALASAMVSLAGIHYFGLHRPAEACVAMLLALPLSRIFAKIEAYHRQYENDAYNKLLSWARKPTLAFAPARLVKRSIAILVPAYFLAFCLALLAMLALLQMLLPLLEAQLSIIPLRWPHLWVMAGIGGILSLRHRPAYIVLVAGAVLILAWRVVFVS